MQVKSLSSKATIHIINQDQRIFMQWVGKQQAVLKTNSMACGKKLEAREVEREYQLVWTVKLWAINCHAVN